MSNLRSIALERYRKWNSAIYATLFSEPRAHAPAYLYLEPELLAAAAALAEAEAGDARAQLVAAVRGSLGWDRVDTPFLWHIDEAEIWEDGGMREPPPFLALLAVLVLAAEAMVSDAQHAAHNYYDRLLVLLDADPLLGARVKRCFKDTVEFWQQLNDWLVQWDGELGLPSAQVTDRRVNIGYPLSQALVSAHDRLRIAGAFEDYGLRPGRRMAPLEMEQYLAHWLATATAPARLRRLWSNEEARRRITLIACAELEAWAGPAVQVHAESASGRVPLLWRAELTPGALRSIDLFLACQADARRVSGGYRVVAPTDGAGREGLADAGGALAIAPMRGSPLCALEPWDAFSLGALLAGAFTLQCEDNPAVTVARSSNPILVLTYDERDALWHEVNRAQLLERSIILAHADVLEKVEHHLQRYARPGFRKLDADTLYGLPVGWAAFLDVLLVDTPEDELRDVLAALSPVRADVIALEGGLRLGRQTWHADAPPELTATLASERPLRLSIERRRALDDGPDNLIAAEGTGRAGAALAGLGLVSGDYRASVQVTARNSVRVLDETPFRLRTASHPRPLRGEGMLSAYSISEASGLVTTTCIADEDALIVQGALLEGTAGEPFAPVPLRLPTTLPVAAPLARPRPSPVTDTRIYAMPCAVRGHHYWIVDAAQPDDNRYTLKHMQCRDCQREEWRRSGAPRRAAPAQRRIRHGYRSTEAPRARLPAAQATDWSRPLPALMLDAMSYMGSGSWAGLREIAQSLAPNEPFFAAEAARALSALGHIDIRLDPRTQRPAGWQIAPPTLVETCDRSWVLAGARSDRLIEALLSVPDTNLAIEGEELPVIRIRPASVVALLELVEALEEQGLAIATSERFSERVVEHLPLLAGLLPLGERFQIGHAKVERLDLGSRQWTEAGEDRGPGAYRVEHHGRLHGVSQAADPGIMRIVDPLSAKHLAAAQFGATFVAYDPTEQILTLPLGAELPMMLDRVATLCAGAPALVRRELWSVQYLCVPPIVARHIQRSLGL
ncbi:MAG: hypothetical protein ACT6Q7_10155 [Blastomonas fulva]|uniref:hypothetical protein n=1 Tax=Blastomonas fulva TaxID=1550728 RepID=UPI0040334207